MKSKYLLKPTMSAFLLKLCTLNFVIGLAHMLHFYKGMHILVNPSCVIPFYNNSTQQHHPIRMSECQNSESVTMCGLLQWFLMISSIIYIITTKDACESNLLLTDEQMRKPMCFSFTITTSSYSPNGGHVCTWIEWQSCSIGIRSYCKMVSCCEPFQLALAFWLASQ